MSHWDDRVAQHPIMGTLSRIRAVLEAPPTKLDEAAIENLDRVRGVTERVASLVADTEATMLVPPLLDRLDAGLSGIAGALETLTAEDSSGLVSADTLIDTFIDTIGWPLAHAAPNPAALREAADSYRGAMGSLVTSLQSEVDNAKTELAAILAEVTEVKAELAKTASEQAAVIAAAAASASASLESVAASVETERVKLAALATDQNTAYLAAESTRTSQATAAIGDTQTRAADALVDVQAKTDQALAEQVAAFAAAEQAAEARHNERICLPVVRRRCGDRGARDPSRPSDGARRDHRGNWVQRRLWNVC